MSSNIAIFAYDFPHRKSCDFIKDLYSYGLKNLVVLAAPKKKITNLITELTNKEYSYSPRPIETSTLCKNMGVPYFKVEHNDTSQLNSVVSDYKIDMAIIAGARIIPSDIIAKFSRGIVNFHPGKIPETSGLDAFPYTLKKGVCAGVTTHLIDHRVDAGYFIRFNKLVIQSDDTVSSTQEKLYQLQRLALQDFCANLADFERNISPIERPRKNTVMMKDERESAFSSFNNWKTQQLRDQNQARFFQACEEGNFDVVFDSLNSDRSMVFVTNEMGWTPLIVACFNQRYEIAKLLLEKGADPNRGSVKGTTPLMYAKSRIVNQSKPDLSLLRLLIDAGADYKRTDSFGKDVIYYIKNAGDLELAKSIVEISSKISES